MTTSPPDSKSKILFPTYVTLILIQIIHHFLAIYETVLQNPAVLFPAALACSPRATA